MTSLSQRITDLADELAGAGVQVVAYIPETIAPPAILIGAGDPFISEGQTFSGDDFQVNLEVYLLVGDGTNQDQQTKLNGLLESVLPLFGDWLITVHRPAVYTVGQSLHYGVLITAANQFTITP